MNNLENMDQFSQIFGKCLKIKLSYSKVEIK